LPGNRKETREGGGEGESRGQSPLGFNTPFCFCHSKCRGKPTEVSGPTLNGPKFGDERVLNGPTTRCQRG
jgi:hypothetical protein